MVGDVDEGEVAADEGRKEDDARDERSAETGDDRVASGEREPPSPGGCRIGAHDDRVHGQAQTDDERDAPELSH